MLLTAKKSPVISFRNDWLYGNEIAELQHKGTAYVSGLKNGLGVCDQLNVDCRDLIDDSLDFCMAISVLTANIIILRGNEIRNIQLRHFDTALAKCLKNESYHKIKEGLLVFTTSKQFGVYDFYGEFSTSICVGLDTSEKARTIVKVLFEILENSICNYPYTIFTLSEGINRSKGDPNYDLYCKACKLTYKTGIPIYKNMDTANPEYINRSVITRFIINLPQIALQSNSLKDFKGRLEAIVYTAKEPLLQRYSALKHIVLFESKSCEESDKPLFELYKKILDTGMLSIGFIGLFQAASVFTESDIKKQAISKSIILWLKELVDKLTEEANRNDILFCLESMQDSFKFEYMCNSDRTVALNKGFSICNARHYTNYFEDVIGNEIDSFKKGVFERPLHEMCVGHITYYNKKGYPIFSPGLLQKSIDFSMDNGTGCLAVIV